MGSVSQEITSASYSMESRANQEWTSATQIWTQLDPPMETAETWALATLDPATDSKKLLKSRAYIFDVLCLDTQFCSLIFFHISSSQFDIILHYKVKDDFSWICSILCSVS